MHNEENKNNSNAMKRVKFTLTSGIVLVMVIASVIVANLLVRAVGSRIPTKYDITSKQVLNFTDETMEVIKNLDKDVTIYSLIPEDNVADDSAALEAIDLVDKVIERYSQLSKRITYKKIDAKKNPDFLYKYSDDDNPISYFSIILECGDKYRVVDLNAIISVNANTHKVQFISAEQKFTIAIMNITSDSEVTVGIVKNHGGVGTFEEFSKEILEPENYKTVEVDLMVGAVSEEVDLLMILAPTIDFTVDEINQLDAYFGKGGRAQLVIDHSAEDFPVLEEYLAEWGVELYDGYIVETDVNNVYSSNPELIMPTLMSSPVTDDIIKNNYRVIYPTARGMKINKVLGVERQDLLVSSEKSYVYDAYDKVDGDIVAGGPIVVTTLLSKMATAEGVPAFLITGGRGIFTRGGSVANMDLFYNSVAYMTNNEQSIFIRPKDITPPVLLISMQQIHLITGITVVAIPLLLLIAGFVVWFIRRRL